MVFVVAYVIISVLTLIEGNKKGITKTEMEEKSVLTDKLIWMVIYRTEKMGKTKKAKRRLCVGQ